MDAHLRGPIILSLIFPNEMPNQTKPRGGQQFNIHLTCYNLYFVVSTANVDSKDLTNSTWPNKPFALYIMFVPIFHHLFEIVRCHWTMFPLSCNRCDYVDEHSKNNKVKVRVLVITWTKSSGRNLIIVRLVTLPDLLRNHVVLYHSRFQGHGCRFLLPV